MYVQYTVYQKNETSVILNILYSCKSIAMKNRRLMLSSPGQCEWL